jgi:hypothetical protein
VETDAIFENVWQINALADADHETMRISIDTKATINVGEYSRGGRSRGVEAVTALDHDVWLKKKMVPGGILAASAGKDRLKMCWVARCPARNHLKGQVKGDRLPEVFVFYLKLWQDGDSRT